MVSTRTARTAMAQRRTPRPAAARLSRPRAALWDHGGCEHRRASPWSCPPLWTVAVGSAWGSKCIAASPARSACATGATAEEPASTSLHLLEQRTMVYRHGGAGVIGLGGGVCAPYRDGHPAGERRLEALSGESRDGLLGSGPLDTLLPCSDAGEETGVLRRLLARRPPAGGTGGRTARARTPRAEPDVPSVVRYLYVIWLARPGHSWSRRQHGGKQRGD